LSTKPVTPNLIGNEKRRPSSREVTSTASELRSHAAQRAPTLSQKLGRDETAIARRLAHTISELETLQAARL
jgi:hypothetical protein